ncbi:NAD(P)-dependent oxidoreductase [Fructilactobacillus florum]|uniref:NAD(P)-dependent oxidoreductase n=1 Tax=Fructilactobacillus florum TaxID=640331 RepID=UPI0002EA776B|nr:NAD(P)-dependent oxidoreductase [Fructilactobacillus florum]
MFKITVYHVREVERPLFAKLNQNNYDINLVGDRLTPATISKAADSDAVLLTAGDDADEKIIAQLHDYGIKYVFTRVVGVDNIDLAATAKYNMQVANVPCYSPRAVAELAFILGMTMFRRVAQAVVNTQQGDFRRRQSYFANEIHDATVGIVGAGQLGTAEAKLYRTMGTRVLAYQRHPDPANQAVEFTDLDTLLKTADIVSLHVPFIPGKTENMIGRPQLDLMKDDAILVNTARGPVVDNQAVATAIQEHRIGGYATDVLLDDNEIMDHKFTSLAAVPNQIDQTLMANYPNVIVTPHMGFYTEKAVADMISISFTNFEQTLKTGQPVYLVDNKRD